MIKYIICCDVCGAEQSGDLVLQSKYGRHLCFCSACASYIKTAQYRYQQVTALSLMPADSFETVTREQYIKEQLHSQISKDHR